MSYWAIARQLGVVRTTVMRVGPEAARFSAYTDCFVNIPPPMTRVETNGTGSDIDDNAGECGDGDGG